MRVRGIKVIRFSRDQVMKKVVCILRVFHVLALCYFLLHAAILPAQNYQAFFGDMHSHSSLSWDAKSGSKMPAQAYAYAKHVARVDFLAISDHTNGLPQANYQIIRAAAAAYDHPDSAFVAIAGQELGSLGGTGYGHMNIFEALTIAGNGLDNDDIRYDLRMAYQFVIDNNVTAQFNHPSTENGNSNFLSFDYYPPAAPHMSSLEVINGTRSTNYERYYLLALQKGWHVSALGDQDNHGPNYGDLRASDGDIYLTGVLADALSKPKILAAIRERRTYAIEANPANDRMHLDTFTADGRWMGETFADADAQAVLELAAHSAAGTSSRFRQAQMYCNGFLIAWRDLNAPSFTWSVIDSHSTGAHYYFAKLVQEDGDFLWTSPIWVDSPGLPMTEPALVSIQSLRQNFSDGVSQALGWINVRVRGVATAGTHFGEAGPGYLQDSTGGIGVFGADFTKAVVTVIGPGPAFEMEVTGAVSQFNGSLEILPYAVRRVDTKPPVAPVLTTTAAIAAQGEAWEGALVKVIKARILAGSFPVAGASANLTIDDGSGPCTLRIDGDTDIAGQPTPANSLDIVGIVNQFDSSPPYREGYQLMPRRRSDIALVTSVEFEGTVAALRDFRLSQNHPNPFTASAGSVFAFTLPVEAEIRFEIFNLLGERVTLLASGRFARGEHRLSWDGRDTIGQRVSAGMYFYRLQAGEGAERAAWSEVKKLVVLP